MNKWMSSHLDYFSDLLISPFFHASPWDMDSGKSKLSSDWHVSYHWTKSRSPEKRGSARPTVGPKELGLTGMVTWLLVPACFLSQHLSLLNSDITVSMTEGSCKNQMKMHVKVPVHCKGAGTWGKLSSLLEGASLPSSQSCCLPRILLPSDAGRCHARNESLFFRCFLQLPWQGPISYSGHGTCQ